MIKLFRCKICGDGYIGVEPPGRCPFCGAEDKWIVEAKLADVTFDVELTPVEKANAEKALGLEVGNSSFYFCAARETDDAEGKILFKALAKVENEHATIWKKLLKLEKVPEANEPCHTHNLKNLEEAHAREERAIKFYRQALAQSTNPRLKQILAALVQVETDHLQLHEQRMASKV